LALGDDEKAGIAYRRSIDLHPERSQGWICGARLFLLNAEFAKARVFCQEHRSHNPEATDGTQLAAEIEFFARNFPEAERLYAGLEQKDPDGGGAFYGGISYKSALGRLTLNKKASRRGDSLLQECLVKELKQLESAPHNPDVLYQISAIESSLGKNEAAIGHLEAAVSAGWIDYRSLSLDPRFDGISNATRFQAILGKLKLRVEDLSKAIKTSL
jgi:tetratricopeptide (TPR) repeat protein